jgi:hypothetical protein
VPLDRHQMVALILVRRSSLGVSLLENGPPEKKQKRTWHLKFGLELLWKRIELVFEWISSKQKWKAKGKQMNFCHTGLFKKIKFSLEQFLMYAIISLMDHWTVRSKYVTQHVIYAETKGQIFVCIIFCVKASGLETLWYKFPVSFCGRIFLN